MLAGASEFEPALMQRSCRGSEDQHRAKDELNNAVLHDNELKIGWGKTVVLPHVALYTERA